jgi:hypothetical protein
MHARVCKVAFECMCRFAHDGVVYTHIYIFFLLFHHRAEAKQNSN